MNDGRGMEILHSYARAPMSPPRTARVLSGATDGSIIISDVTIHRCSMDVCMLLFLFAEPPVKLHAVRDTRYSTLTTCCWSGCVLWAYASS